MRLGLVFLVLLALIWAVVLLPSLLRTRLEGSPIDGVRSFEHAMGILGNARRRSGSVPGRWVMVPKDVTVPQRRHKRVIAKRRSAFQRMLVVCGATFVLGLVPPLRAVLWLHLACDAALGVYVWRLLQWKREEAQRQRVVRRLRAAPDPEPAREPSERVVGHSV